MGDFYQNGIITNFHNLKTRDLEELEKELSFFSKGGHLMRRGSIFTLLLFCFFFVAACSQKPKAENGLVQLPAIQTTDGKISEELSGFG